MFGQHLYASANILRSPASVLRLWGHKYILARRQIHRYRILELHGVENVLGFSRQEYWSGLPFPSPGDLPNPGIEPRSPTLQADALTSAPPGKPVGEPVWKLKSRNPGSISFQNVENSIPGPPGMHGLCAQK